MDMHFARRSKLAAVVDVGGASAGMALCECAHGRANVLAASRGALNWEDRDDAALVSAICNELSESGAAVLKRSQESAHAGALPVYAVVHQPWVSSQTLRAESHYDAPKQVTEQMIRDLARRALADAGAPSRDTIFESSVIHVELNGYATAHPRGKRAGELAVSVLASRWERGMRPALSKALESLAPHQKPTFRSATRALITVMHDRADLGSNYLIADLEGEATTLVAVRDGVASEQVVVHEGMRSIVKRASALGMPEETMSLMRMLARDDCSSASCEVVRNALARSESELVRVFGEGLAACASSERLPEKLVLMAHPDIAPWMSAFFTRIDFTQFTETARPFTVLTLTTDELSAAVAAGKGVELDPSLALACALVNRELAQS